MVGFLSKLEENIHAYPHKVALEFIDPPHQRLTYAQLGEQLQRTQAYLISLGLQPGDRVALQLPKCLEFILLHLAALRLGAISLPLNPAYPPAETSYFLVDASVRFFFCAKPGSSAFETAGAGLPSLERCLVLEPSDPDRFDSLLALVPLSYEPPPMPAPERTAVIIYTSGTTGRSKGAQISHSNLSANLESLRAAWDWVPDDLLLHVLPIFHVHGLFVALSAALYAGATTLLMRQFDPLKTLQSLVERNCTVFMGVPTVHRRLLAVPDAGGFDLRRVRLITSGSDRLPDDLFAAFQHTFGVTLLERYGLTETGMNLSNPLHGERRVGSVGLPLPGVEARVVDPQTGELLTDGQVGEIQVRGPHVFPGYWNQPEKTRAAFTPDGWFRTGDLGLREADGYFTLRGRAKDLIITGGLNVYPPEVERALSEHPAVAACAVIGCPDPEWGERVVAVVVPHPGLTLSAEALISYCRERLAAYKSPKTVILQPDLPRNAMGKVQKETLKKTLCHQPNPTP